MESLHELTMGQCIMREGPLLSGFDNGGEGQESSEEIGKSAEE